MTLLDPYASVDWSVPALRGNLHAHSTRSDGQGTPQEMLDAFARVGHGFAMLSDHDRWTSPEELAALDGHGMALIPGLEVSADGEHILQVGGSAPVAPDPDRQRVIDAIAASGGIAVMNHPRWFHGREHCPLERLQALRGYAGIEVVNAVIDELEGERWAFSTWDMLLGSGRRAWGFANDDAHRVSHVGQAWNAAYPLAPGAAGVVEALASGRFCPSTGLALDGITVAGDEVEVRCAAAARIIAFCDRGRRVACQDGPLLRARLPDGATYLRFACLGAGERGVWTQPFFRA